MSPDICIYHGNCADGFGAAWAVWRKFGDNVEYVPGVYGKPPPEVAGKHVVMVDFSYKRAALDEMAQMAASIVIVDHHKTAQADLEPFTATMCGGAKFVWSDVEHMLRDMVELKRPAIVAHFDMDRSGAQMAWDCFHPSDPRPKLIDYVGDRDLWRFALPYSREIAAWVFSYPYAFDVWEDMSRQLGAYFDGCVAQGMAIERKHHKDIAELVNVTRRTMRIGGVDMPVANLPYTLTSDAGHLMATHDQGVAACYWDTPSGRVFSLRSTNDGPDVSEIAKRYGGGGHRNAAGFQVPLGWEGEPPMTTTALVERLRANPRVNIFDLCDEAADEIAWLRKHLRDFGRQAAHIATLTAALAAEKERADAAVAALHRLDNLEGMGGLGKSIIRAGLGNGASP